MLSSAGPDNKTDSKGLLTSYPGSRALFRSIRLVLTVVLACSAILSSQQGGGAGAEPKAAPKPSENPLSSLLNQKPAPVVKEELPAAIPLQPVPIPLPDVAARSLELSQQLRDIEAKLPTREQLEEIKTAIYELQPDLQSKEQELSTMLAGTPSSLEVREEENYWRGIQVYTADWQQQLLAWANNAQTAINLLDAQEPVWAATLEANKDNKELGPVLSVLQENLADIRRLRAQAKAALQVAVNLQITVGTIDQTAADMISRLIQVRAKLKGRLLDRDSLPLWKVGARRDIGESRMVSGSLSSRWISIKAFLKENKGTNAFLIALLLLSLAGARRLYEITRDKQPTDELEADAYRILHHWIAVALLLPLILSYVLAPTAPVTLLGLVILVSFVPILIILPPLLDRRFRLLLYFFAATYAFNWSISWMGVNPSLRRELQFAANAVLFLVLAYLVRPSRKAGRNLNPWARVILLGVRVGVAGLGVSLVADLFGYVKLAHYLGLACVYSAFIAISVFTALRVCEVLLTVGLRSPMAERLAAVRIHRVGIVRWAPRALRTAAFVIWVLGTGQLVGFDNSLRNGLNNVLDFRLAGGSSGATLGSVLGFFLILVIGYGVASAVRFFFREEIFRRFHMSRGLPELIASIIYYLLLVFVFLSAINVGGIELNKFTILTGAFGVGIGFGMQNIINNFVSGLILQFERPVHIDDIIEVDANTGKVTRIGVRSSTIQTFQGAEVIIPNANLISNKVINWTLSESRRRRELPVGVAYGTDPKVVLNLLRQAAAKHELVLTKPEPLAYFKGFGESSLDFELHFWVMQENNGMLITSEVAVEAMRLLDDAGIEIPFPQRDLHVRSIDPTAAAGMLSNEHQIAPIEKSQFESLEPEVGHTRRTTGD